MLNNSDDTLLHSCEEDRKSKEFSLRLESSSDDEEDKENKEITVAVTPGKKKKKLNIKMPTLGDHQFKASVLDMNVVDDDEEEGFRTPTSSDKKIPVMISPKCPPPPRKPKSTSLSLPTTNYKRKTPSSSPSSSSSKMNLPCRCRCRILISDEDIKSLFPPIFLADLGRKIKKARSTTGFN